MSKEIYRNLVIEAVNETEDLELLQFLFSLIHEEVLYQRKINGNDSVA